jgi:methylmalonyl-CoA mutase N-terminal domain/subunit
MRIITDIFSFCSENVPMWNTISISGYHIREAGSTAIQEVAFTLANGIAYVEAALDAGLKVDDFAPRLSFFFNAHLDFFEEVAKFRAARRLWARIMKERFLAKSAKSLMLRFHTQTAGCALTAQQPQNNVIRVTLQALSAVLGGTQSLHTNSMDEAFSLPSEEAVQTALRTQQVIAYESGVASTADPLGGSFYVERLTDALEERAQAYLDKIDEMGGAVVAVERGYIQKEIQESAYAYQKAVETAEQVVVGLNKFKEEGARPANLLRVDQSVMKSQLAKLDALKAERDNAAVQSAIGRLRESARGSDNLMPPMMEAVGAYATLGEICDALREVFGEYTAVSTL